MDVISLRVDTETKRGMENVKINWSDFLRGEIKGKIAAEGRKRTGYAVKLNMEILRSQKAGADETTQLIRKFREERK